MIIRKYVYFALYWTERILATARIAFDLNLEIIRSQSGNNYFTNAFPSQTSYNISRGAEKTYREMESAPRSAESPTRRRRPFESRTIPASGAMRTAYAGGRDRTLASVYYRFPKLISNSRGTSGTGAMSAVAVPAGGSYPENRLVDRKREGERNAGKLGPTGGYSSNGHYRMLGDPWGKRECTS